MFDQYLVKYIKDFLKECPNCHTYDTFVFDMNCCFMCKKYFCSKCCKTCLVKNDTDFDITMNYCLVCDYKINIYASLITNLSENDESVSTEAPRVNGL